MVKKTGDLLRPRQRRQSHLLQRLDLQAVEYGPIDEDRIQLSADIVASRRCNIASARRWPFWSASLPALPQDRAEI